MEPQIAYWAEPEVNPNFQTRAPDPGAFAFLKNAGWDALYHSPFSGAYRFSEMSIEKTDYLNPGGNVLQPDEANEKYGLGGQLKFDEPIKEDAAALMLRRKIAENDRAYIAQSGATTGFRQVAGFGVGMAASLIDPVNVAMMFVPVVGEARFAAMVAKYGVTRARLATGAIEGLVGSALAEPFVLLPALQEQANYGLKDSAMNLGFGAVLGAGLHAGLGAIGDRIKALKPKESNAIFESAMNDVLQDRPVSAPAKVYEFTDHFEEVSQRDPTIITTPEKSAESKTLGEETQPLLTSDEVDATISRLTSVSKEEIVDASSGKYSSKELSNKMDETLNNLDVLMKSGATISETAPIQELAGLYKNLIQRQSDREIALRTIPNSTGITPEPSINDIPLRDSKGHFLSKQTRLDLLNKKINDQIAAREIQRGQKIDIDTQSNTPRDNPDIPSRSMDDSDVTHIDSQTADLEAELKGMDPEEAKAFKEQVDELTKDIGDPAKRAKAVEAATNCIISRIL